MIYVSDSRGKLVKSFPEPNAEMEFGFHTQYGLTSEILANDKRELRKKRGLLVDDHLWECKFKFTPNSSTEALYSVSALNFCKVKNSKSGQWVLETEAGKIYYIHQESEENSIYTRLGPISSQEEKRDRTVEYCSLLAVLLLFLSFFQSKAPVVEEQAVQESVIVKIDPPKNTVKLPPSVMKNLSEVARKDVKAQRAVEQNLGFLGMLGKKNLKNAVGGAPTELKDASAGAGAGGTEGSGGELLVGLGAGVKRTTVGNSGTSGLGGVGTKGKGGGLGGYGDTSIGSGEGRSLSQVALSQEMLLDGGLDRSVIQATIAKYLSQVRACYESGLQRNAGLTGIVNMNFEINPSGNLNFSKVKSSSLGDVGVENCISEKMMSWQFPKPVGGVKVKVNYPFLLRPVST